MSRNESGPTVSGRATSTGRIVGAEHTAPVDREALRAERRARKKAKRLAAEAANAAEGYIHADGYGTCCLCSRRIYTEQIIRKLPDGWNPESTRRHAHRKCVLAWVADLEQRSGRKISLRVTVDGVEK